MEVPGSYLSELFSLQCAFLKACKEEVEHERKMFQKFPEYFSRKKAQREKVPVEMREMYEVKRADMKKRIYSLAGQIEKFRYM